MNSAFCSAARPPRRRLRQPLLFGWSVVALACVALSGCTRDGKFQAISMWNDSRYKPLEEEPSEDGSSSRELIPGTVARGQLRTDDAYFTGMEKGKAITTFPIRITPAVMKRGQERYDIFCAPCHSGIGDGEGIIVKRGFAKPPSYHIERLRKAPPGHFYDVITNGYGAMYSYASRVKPDDRWAITAYIRALQRSQNARSGDVPPAKQARLEPAVSKRSHSDGAKRGGR